MIRLVKVWVNDGSLAILSVMKHNDVIDRNNALVRCVAEMGSKKIPIVGLVTKAGLVTVHLEETVCDCGYQHGWCAVPESIGCDNNDLISALSLPCLSCESCGADLRKRWVIWKE
jgi:hypothetical protein